MKLQECYTLMGENLQEVLSRLPSEKLVEKFLLKFLADKSYAELCSSLDEKDAETAFRMAHTLKGVCQNLGLKQLGAVSSDLCEALRGGTIPAEAEGLLSAVQQQYEKTVSAIKTYEAEKEV